MISLFASFLCSSAVLNCKKQAARSSSIYNISCPRKNDLTLAPDPDSFLPRYKSKTQMSVKINKSNAKFTNIFTIYLQLSDLMDFEEGGCLRNVFRSFVCAALTLLLGLHIYGYIKENETFEGDFTDIKYVVMQLSRDLAEVNRKHEQLQGELDSMSAALPGVSAAALRARGSLEPASRLAGLHTHEVTDYDRQVADYALESAGARILDTGNTVEHFVYESPVSWALHALTTVVCRECLSARTMIQPGNLPGECWAFKGTRGEVYIRLLGSIHISGVSLEHIPPHISPTKEISSAPRHFQLEGLEHRSDQYPHDFGTFEYDKKGKPIQYFDVIAVAPRAYNVVRLRIMSNWGHPVYTCVYRLRVHGELAAGQARSPNDDIDMRIDNE